MGHTQRATCPPRQFLVLLGDQVQEEIVLRATYELHMPGEATMRARTGLVIRGCALCAIAWAAAEALHCLDTPRRRCPRKLCVCAKTAAIIPPMPLEARRTSTGA